MGNDRLSEQSRSGHIPIAEWNPFADNDVHAGSNANGYAGAFGYSGQWPCNYAAGV